MPCRVGNRVVNDDDILNLIERYRQGDDDAADALFNRYVSRLISLAQSRLSSKLSRRIDPEDIVQSAYRSFFVRARDGKFDFQENGDLWRLLAVITLNKLRQKVEYHTAGKRRVDQEQSDRNSDHRGAAREAVTREPSPVEALAVIEEIEQLTRGLDSVQRQIVQMRLQGHLIEEIAVEVSRSERTVRRVMDKVKARLQQRLKEQDGDDETG